MASTSVASRASLSPICRQTHQSGPSSKDACIPVQARSSFSEVTSVTRINQQRSVLRSKTFGHFGRRQAQTVRRQARWRAAAALGSESDSSEDGNVKDFFNDEEFQKYLQDAGDKLVVVDISTKTCGPCKMIYPKVVEMSEEFTDAVFLKIQGDHDQGTRALMKEWKISSVPSFRFYRKGELIHSHTGAKVEKLMEEFQKHYSSVNA